jgi:hypothetical protein
MQRKSSRNAKPLRAARGSSQLRKARGNQNPPQLPTNIRLNHRFRFLAATAFNGFIDPLSMIACGGAVCTVANTTLSVIGLSAKIRKIEVWGAPASQGASSTVTLEWVGASNSPNIEVSDTTISVATNCHIVTVPPKDSLASFWTLSTTGGLLFRLQCPANSIVDLTMDLILADQAAATSTVTVVAGTLGELYFTALDGVGTNVLRPVSLNTTA